MIITKIFHFHKGFSSGLTVDTSYYETSLVKKIEVENVKDANDCQMKCQCESECGLFVYGVGIPHFSGCYLFKPGTPLQNVTMLAGPKTCPEQADLETSCKSG